MEKFPTEPTEPDLNVGPHFSSESALEKAYIRIDEHRIYQTYVDGTIIGLIEDLNILKDNPTTSIDDVGIIQGDISELQRYDNYRKKGKKTNNIDLVVELSRKRLERTS